MSSAVEFSAREPRGVPPLLAKLIDDAALFPPANTPLSEAITAHLRGMRERWAGVLGRFLCPASRLAELISELAKVKPRRPLPLSLVVDTGLGGVPKAVSIIEGRQELIDLHMIEMPAPSDVDSVWLERVSEFVPEEVIRVVEPRRGGDGWLDGVRRVVEHGCWPKLRCGGPTPQSYPDVDVVADFLDVVCPARVPFKATAGLHNAVCYTDSTTGVAHHGFLNMLVATARALSTRQGPSRQEVRSALTGTDGAALAGEVRGLDAETAKATRAVFASYGSCSLTEPVGDLEGLGLL